MPGRQVDPSANLRGIFPEVFAKDADLSLFREFSRIRAQYAWDDASDGPTDEQFFLQYIYALGAHGAHKF